MKDCITWTFITFSVLLAGCGDPNFDRDIGEDLIDETEAKQLLMTEVPLQKNTREMYVAQGFESDEDLQREFFAQMGEGGGKKSDGFRIKEPATIDISITGISEDSSQIGIKQAEFMWTYENLPSLVKRFAIKGGSGTASFKLFDDGWRVLDVKFERSNEPFPLTNDEQEEIKRNVEEHTESVRIKREKRTAELVKEHQERVKRKSIAKERLDKLVIDSRKETKTIHSEIIEWPRKRGTTRFIITNAYVKGVMNHNDYINNVLTLNTRVRTEILYFQEWQEFRCGNIGGLGATKKPKDYRYEWKGWVNLVSVEKCKEYLPKVQVAVEEWKKKYGDELKQLRLILQE
jgi:hypothetical protein